MLDKKPKAAATVILIRPQEAGYQVYLLKRSVKSKFMAGNYVFPGGMVDASDGDIERWQAQVNLSPSAIERHLGGSLSSAEALSYGVAAIRETFEEAGVLLADMPTANQAALKCVRDQQDDLGPGWFLDAACANGWRLTLDRLFRWAHWITPTAMKYQYDTRFFVAVMPSAQVCQPDNQETTVGLWIDPRSALEGNMAGSLALSPPTMVTLHMLLQFPTYLGLMDELATRSWGQAYHPRMLRVPPGAVLIEPWDPQYDWPEIEIDPETLSAKLQPVGADFSRVWLQDGFWRPILV